MAELARGFTREAPPEEDAPEPATTVIVDPDKESVTVIDEASGASKTELPDGAAIIDLAPRVTQRLAEADFDANLAETLDQAELGRIGAELTAAIQTDDDSRKDWIEIRAKGIDMLGFRIEEPRGDAGASTAPVEGMSTVRHPLLAESVIRFQSNAAAELLPAGGPVKVRNDAPPAPPAQPPAIGHNGGPPLDAEPNPNALWDAQIAPDEPDPQASPELAGLDGADLAEALELDLNHYLTAVDRGYRADTDRMLFWVGFGGCAFKKVYNDPIRRMPISRSVDAKDLIVSNDANDLEDAGRVTHRVKMRKSGIVRMQLAGVYRKMDLPQPYSQPDAIEQKISDVQGFISRLLRPEDSEFTIDECYVELSIKGDEHLDEDGKETGLMRPYRVTMDKDSHVILEIRRNWKEDDELCLPKKTFVKFPFIPALGFYDIGLLQVLGNSEKALTGAWRLMLDAGMFASFPGFLYADAAGRQQSNEFRVPPGGGVKIQTGGRPIGDVVSKLPYPGPSQALAEMSKQVELTGQRVGGTAELQVGEGRQDAPVGTTLALIEQATKMLAAVHIRLHAAQSEEFQLLKDRFREDPEAFWRNNPRCSKQWKRDEFLAALDNCDLVPAADPNTPSHMHRIMKAVAVKQLQAMNPQLYDAEAVDSRILRMIGVQDPSSLFSKAPPTGPQAPPPDPAKMAELQMKGKEQQDENAARITEAQLDAAASQRQDALRAQEAAVESGDRAADRASRERVAAARAHTERVKLIGNMLAKGVPIEEIGELMASMQPASAPPTPPTPAPVAQPQNEPAMVKDMRASGYPAPWTQMGRGGRPGGF